MIKYHWKELKYRFYYYLISLILSWIIIWFYKLEILFSISDIKLIYTSLLEAFEQYLYFTFLISFIFNIPILIYHYLIFIIPGLYKFELKKVIYNIIKYFILIIIFYYTCFYYIFDLVIDFFYEFQSEYLTLNLKIKDFLSFFNSFLFGSLFLISLSIMNINLNNKRKIIYFSLLIFIAFITPPDLISLILSIFPIIILVELNYFFKLLYNI